MSIITQGMGSTSLVTRGWGDRFPFMGIQELVIGSFIIRIPTINSFNIQIPGAS